MFVINYHYCESLVGDTDCKRAPSMFVMHATIVAACSLMLIPLFMFVINCAYCEQFVIDGNCRLITYVKPHMAVDVCDALLL